MSAGRELVLGRAPSALSVLLTDGAEFTATLRSQDDTGAPVGWPAGASLRLAIGRGGGTARSWPFVITGPLARIEIPAADITALPDGPLRAHLWLDYGDGEFLWCSGRVSRSA